MKKSLFILAAFIMACLPLKAQQLIEDSFSQLRVHFNTPDLSVDKTIIDGLPYGKLTIEGYIAGGEVGTPALPQFCSLITVPVCKNMEIVVENAKYDTVQLPMGFIIMPMEPSISKSDSVLHRLSFNQQVYGVDRFAEHPLATVEYIGIARDRHLAQLVFSPVTVNPESKKAIVCRSADITVKYTGADKEATIDLFKRHYTPAFSIGNTLNQLLSPKYVSNATPVRLSVIAPSSMRCNKLEEFLQWKRQQGFRVDMFYTDELGIQSASAIANMLTGLYNNATENNPAPAYLIIVGDIAQVPSHNSKLSGGGWYAPSNDHITDLYYTTWTSGDKVPDCYQGRLSATDTNMLGKIIEKTLLYERYEFPDDSYLARAALIAGVDGGYSGDHGYTHADPNMDYAAKFYINHANGYDTVVYFKNRTTSAPDSVYVTGSSNTYNAASILKSFYDTGAAWINYTAHGGWNCWADPEFNVSDANKMKNYFKPSFMIGNCCISNKFNEGNCFGEAVLRKGDFAGAIGYIGGSDNTYWDEDFYWSVGVRNNISATMALNYSSNNLGAYDRVFHTHNEPLSGIANTAGKIVMFGNAAVQSSSSSLKDYYWEIYHLMGDPTLMPWMGRAEEPYVVLVDNGSTTVSIRTLAGAYVAVVSPSDSMRVVSAAFADANGNATLSVPPTHSGLMLSVNTQNHKPFSQLFANLGITDAEDVQASIYPNPATGSVKIACKDMQSIQLVNSLGQTVRTYGAHNDNTTIDLQGLNAGVYIIRIATANGIATQKLIVK